MRRRSRRRGGSKRSKLKRNGSLSCQGGEGVLLAMYAAKLMRPRVEDERTHQWRLSEGGQKDLATRVGVWMCFAVHRRGAETSLLVSKMYKKSPPSCSVVQCSGKGISTYVGVIVLAVEIGYTAQEQPG